MQLSLIVATRDRPDYLARLLESLLRQLHRDFEVIIIDQSEPENRSQNAKLIARLNDDLTIQHVPTDTRGLSRARNIGLGLASGQRVAFPDDDCWYSDTVLQQVSQWFDEHEQYTFLSGQYTEPGVENPGFPKQSAVLKRTNNSFDCSSVTLWIDRNAIESAQLRFDENIGAGTELPAGEECDFLIYLIKAGNVGFYDPALIIYHQIERQSDVHSGARQKHEVAYGYLIGKHIFTPGITVRLGLGMISLFSDMLLRRSRLPRLKSRLKGIRLGIKAGRHYRNQNEQ